MDTTGKTGSIETGKQGERIALAYLKKKGYRIVEQNYRCPIGEIDIVARDKGELVLLKLKTRKSVALGYPEQAVGSKKQKISHSPCGIFRKKIDRLTARLTSSRYLMLPFPNEVRLIPNAFDFTLD